MISLFLSDVEGLSVVRALRVARTLRPLRVIQRNPGLRQVVSSLFMAVPGCLSVGQVWGLVMLVYGRFLMQFLLCENFGARSCCTGYSEVGTRSAETSMHVSVTLLERGGHPSSEITPSRPYELTRYGHSERDLSHHHGTHPALTQYSSHH